MTAVCGEQICPIMRPKLLDTTFQGQKVLSGAERRAGWLPGEGRRGARGAGKRPLFIFHIISNSDVNLSRVHVPS